MWLSTLTVKSEGSLRTDAGAQVRAAAVGAVGRWLGSADVLRELSQGAQLVPQCLLWAEAVSMALLDPAHAVSASGFAAIRSVIPRPLRSGYLSRDA